MHLGNIGPSRSAGDGREALPRVRPDMCRRSFFVPLRMGSWVIGAEALCDLATPDRVRERVPTSCTFSGWATPDRARARPVATASANKIGKTRGFFAEMQSIRPA